MITFQWTVPPGLPSAGTVRNAFIMAPSSPKASKRAVFYEWSEYAGAGAWTIPEINDPTSQMFVQLGLYVIGLDQGNSFGAYRTEIPAFMAYMHATYGVALQPSAWLRSRGGMWGNLAADTANFFDRIGGVAPITDAQSYDPVGIAESFTGDTSDPPAQSDFAAVPSVACPTLPTASGSLLSLLQQNALNGRAAAIVSSGVPMYFGYGTADTTVAPSSNILTFATNYAAAGGTKLKTLAVAGADHAAITTTLYQRLIDFMVSDNPEQVMTLPLYSKGCPISAQSVAGNGVVQINLAAQDDPNGMINGSNQMVIPVGGGGLWDCRGKAQITLPAGTDFWLALRKNGAITMLQRTMGATNTGPVDGVPVEDAMICNDGDVIDYAVYVFATGSFAITINSTTTNLLAERRS